MLKGSKKNKPKEELFPFYIADKIVAGESLIKIMRQYRKMTQVELSEKSGVSIENIRKLEKGEPGTKKDRRAIGKALNLGADFFI